LLDARHSGSFNSPSMMTCNRTMAGSDENNY